MTQATVHSKVPSQAIAFGNPPWKLPGPDSPGADLYNGVIRKSTTIETGADGRGYYGRCLFGFQIDQTRYDTGSHIFVEYARNKELSDCAENRLLDRGDFMTHIFFYHEIIPLVELSDPILHLTFKTIDGRVTVTHNPLPTIKYPLIPDDTGLPVIPISSLTWHQSLTLTTVDLVEAADGEMYVFKHDSQVLDVIDMVSQPSGDIPLNDDTVQEIACLNRFQSPFIIKPLFIVSDTADPLRCRGFLMPFFRAGSLVDVLARLRKTKYGDGVRVCPRLTSTPSTFPTSPSLPIDAEGAVRYDHPKLLEWSVKQFWACDIARGVVLLHENSLPSGDLKLDNVLLGPDGRICHIDIFYRGSTDIYVPPEYDFGLPTKAHDIFSMGLMLWALSEEYDDFERNSLEIPRLFWQEGEGAAPLWYRELVGSCLDVDADKRPSAQVVLDALVKGSADL